MDFEHDSDAMAFASNSCQKPASHLSLNYFHWRQDILPAIQSQMLFADEIIDDDLHEFEEINYMNKQSLDV